MSQVDLADVFARVRFLVLQSKVDYEGERRRLRMSKAVINLERGQPDLEAAMTRLRLELSTLRRIGVKTIKIIHGYGSSGQGGAIRVATHQYLHDQLSSKRIRAFCPGDRFGPFETAGRQIAAMVPVLRQDQDWGHHNDGITIVVLL